MDSAHHSNSLILSSGSLKLDLALPLGGLPPGDVLLIHGPHESGKTVLCMAMLARNAKSGHPGDKAGGLPGDKAGGHTGLLIDADGTLEPGFAVRCGLDPTQTYLCKPTTPGDALDMAETLLASGACPLVIVDSASALLDTGEESADAAGESLLAAYLPRLRRLARENSSLLVFTERPNPQASAVYHGLKNHLPRLALPLRADWRFSLSPAVESHASTNPASQAVRIQVRGRSTYTTPVITIQINLMYNQGVARCGEILELGLYHSIIQRQEAEYQFRGLLMGKDLEEACGFLTSHPDLAEMIEQDIRRFYRAAA